MKQELYDSAPVGVRADLEAAHQRKREQIAKPGTWLDGAMRVAIAAETRHAKDCALCRARKEALSPSSVTGAHDSLGELSDTVVDVVHRIATDPGRLTEGWYRKCLERGLIEEEYVEIVGVVCSTVSLDTFAKAIGVDALPLPEPKASEPTRVRPPEARQGDAWVPWIAGPDASDADIEAFGPSASNVRRALSLVPAEAYSFFDMVSAQYLDARQMRDFDTPHRAIDRAQIELIAGRISFLNQCAY